MWSYSTWMGDRKRGKRRIRYTQLAQMNINEIKLPEQQEIQFVLETVRLISSISQTRLSITVSSLSPAWFFLPPAGCTFALKSCWLKFIASLCSSPFLQNFNPGKILFCLYNWAISRSWAGMEAAAFNQHSHGLGDLDYIPVSAVDTGNVLPCALRVSTCKVTTFMLKPSLLLKHLSHDLYICT